MKKLSFISVQPLDNTWLYQIELQIENLIELGFKQDYHILIYRPIGRPENINWKRLEEKYKEYPQFKFFYYEGTPELNHQINLINYIPLIRPYCLSKHFSVNPDLQSQYLFYWDCDVLFTKYIDLEPLCTDVDYISDAGGYMDHDYFKGKITGASNPKILEEFDVMGKLADYFKLPANAIEAHKGNTGGVQYIFKPGLSSKFWDKVFEGCRFIRMFLQNTNQIYFPGNNEQERENNGFQSWCADLHSILYTLWEMQRHPEVSRELDFCWNTDQYEKIKLVNLFHNAGVPSENFYGKKMFYKGKYTNNQLSPHRDDLSSIDSFYAGKWYAEQLQKIKNPIWL